MLKQQFEELDILISVYKKLSERVFKLKNTEWKNDDEEITAYCKLRQSENILNDIKLEIIKSVSV